MKKKHTHNILTKIFEALELCSYNFFDERIYEGDDGWCVAAVTATTATMTMATMAKIHGLCIFH